MKNRIFSGAPSEDFAGYAKAVIDGSTIYVSGTMGQDPATGAMPESASDQARNALASIGSALAKAGASLKNAVACRVYITDASYLKDIAPVLGEVFRDIRPTNTLLICQLPAPGAKVEIEVTASTRA
ncbi:RidA family protein [Mesorhizobium australicum]|uniref:Enamine deaminase RidA, house cleaning of reactive enamine intermediates, YjgF/YER057c/UK114 family n=1 Tax=Mesorhizobium australicum TaxID=536018 RepID=A0A1X7PRB9_9HYPH|nr:RidA family protein [Mesorhizobium australicum]SMH53838.1 Enamine deaminase RidA, house cleaning of reactive enamine intermediates, YjgF/YER057c/UK114 family [Mesorhizobium australicum]